MVGARCAGSPIAMLLARRGLRVLLVDRATFPSDILSTHYIHNSGVAALHRWGLLDALAATGCPPIRQTTLDVGPVALTGSPLPADGVADAYCPRRTVLDKLLVDAAAQAGAEVREGFVVKELVWDGDRVVGIRGGSHGDPMVTEMARVVVGADGMHSFVARQVKAPTYHERPALTCGYYAYWSGMDCSGIEVYTRPGRCLLAFPTHDGLTCIAIVWPHAEFHQVRAGIESQFSRALDLAPDLAERVQAGRREERYIGTADTANFFRQPYGPGWALVGDAGYHKDPIIGRGITDGFLDAERLSAALADGLAGSSPLPRALAHYQHARDQAFMPIYEITCQRARLAPPPPEMLGLIAALRHNPEQANRFLSINSGTVAASDFFALENIQRIMAAARPALAA
ncbi:MAG: FAD-dependent monooxygenase [Anaerolineae bacterium]|nr:FAD-dependent monooxygenase [Anaerolineae bacterium]